MDVVDAVVVGAGWYGLAAAKTYIELHPEEEVIIVEAAATVGGVWAAHRLYPGLKSNNMLGTYEYSDYPMDEVIFGVRRGEHVPAAVLHEYLTSYAKHFRFFDRIRFNTTVESAEPGEKGGWLLRVKACDGESPLSTKRLIVATGLTSEAYMPQIAGSEEFQGRIFHSRYFWDHKDTLRTAKTVAVLGGAKSAWDAAYAYASAGIPVHMIIRESGHGPVWMAPAYVTPLKKWLEKLVHTRFLTWFSPCIWGAEDGYGAIRRWFHGTAIGRGIVDTFWKVLAKDVVDHNGFEKHPEVRKLKPWNPAFWIGSGLSILNYETDFFELVRDGRIKVFVAEIDRLTAKTVHLSTGEDIPADVLLCATGWKAHPPMQFHGATSDEQLGLPFHSTDPDTMAPKADAEILAQFPRLKDQPMRRGSSAARTDGYEHPFRLYRFMVPPPARVEERSIAFAGMLSTISTAICAQTQALWIAAYFDGRLDRWPDAAEREWQTMLHSRFGRWRYPCGYGSRVPDFAFDTVPYVDMLMTDLGLRSHRKVGGWKEVFAAYGPEDYRGLVGEWKEGRGWKD